MARYRSDAFSELCGPGVQTAMGPTTHHTTFWLWRSKTKKCFFLQLMQKYIPNLFYFIMTIDDLHFLQT